MDQSTGHSKQRKGRSCVVSSTPPPSKGIPVLISVIVDGFFLSTSWVIHLTGIPQEALLRIWFPSGTDMPARFLHLVGSRTLSFFIALYYSII